MHICSIRYEHFQEFEEKWANSDWLSFSDKVFNPATMLQPKQLGVECAYLILSK